MSAQNPEIFFEKRGGFGPLALYWGKGPYGLAVEATKGNGVGFFDPLGNLLAVQFDMVQSNSDHQTLEFDFDTTVEIKIRKGKIIFIKKIAPRKLAA